jgi:hypothetical protein
MKKNEERGTRSLSLLSFSEHNMIFTTRDMERHEEDEKGSLGCQMTLDTRVREPHAG